MNPYREASSPVQPCPRCGVELSTRPIADARVDECPRCAGVFVPSTLLPRFVDALDLAPEVIAAFPEGETVAHPGGPMYVKCPRCRSVMNRRLFAPGSKVVVDVCRGHGVWFDDAELRAIADFAAAGGMEHARRIEAAQKRELAKRARQVPREHDATRGLADEWTFWSLLVDAIVPGRR